jgi:hypothetical protein
MDRIVVAHISTYPPRECGIALYTKALIESVDDDRFTHLVLAVDDGKRRHQYDQSVRLIINPNNADEFAKAARFLNESDG